MNGHVTGWESWMDVEERRNTWWYGGTNETSSAPSGSPSRSPDSPPSRSPPGGPSTFRRIVEDWGKETANVSSPRILHSAANTPSTGLDPRGSKWSGFGKLRLATLMDSEHVKESVAEHMHGGAALWRTASGSTISSTDVRVHQSTSPPVHQSNEKPHVNGREGAFLQKTPINLSNVPSPKRMSPCYSTTEAKFQFDTMIEQMATRCKRPAR